jgi:hypothetical protein
MSCEQLADCWCAPWRVSEEPAPEGAKPVELNVRDIKGTLKACAAEKAH